MKKTYFLGLIGAAMLVGASAPALAWDCNYWSQSTDPTAECYKAPTTNGQQKQQQGQAQGQAQGQHQTAKGGNATGGAGGNATAAGGSGGAGGAGGAGGNGGNGGNGGSSNQSQTNTASANASGNGAGQSTSFSEEVDYPRQTPPAFAPAIPPTASCEGSFGVGAGAPVASFSLGFSHAKKECDKRETARMLFAAGQYRLAMEVLCSTKSMHGIKCQYKAPTPVRPAVDPTPTPTPTPRIDDVSHEELQASERRIDQHIDEVEQRILQRLTSK